MQDGVITNNKRIVETIDTLKDILAKNPTALTIMSHMGRPKGQVVEKQSLKPVAIELEKLLDRKVTFIEDCVGSQARVAVDNAKDGEVILLENLRFYPEEEGKGLDELGEMVEADPKDVTIFRNTLSSFGDIFINDAFGTCHRAHSSMVGVDCGIKAAGYLLERELRYFDKALQKPERPLLVVMGGAKVEDKILAIMNLMEKADDIIIGSAMAYPFLKVLHNMDFGKSLYNPESEPLVFPVLKKATATGCVLHFPKDFVCGDSFSNDANLYNTNREDGMADDWIGMDHGPTTCKLFEKIVHRAKTIIWNGPQGVFEFKKFAVGSEHMANAIADRTSMGAQSIVGGGDSVSLIENMGNSKRYSHLSTGGGACQELMEGKALPGIMALDLK